jgi:hypothetical protein
MRDEALKARNMFEKTLNDNKEAHFAEITKLT